MKIIKSFTLGLVLLASLVWPCGARAGDVTKTAAPFTAARTDAAISLINTGVYNHRLTWTGKRATACSITLEQSYSGVSSWHALIPPQDCTVDGSTTAVGYTNYIRIRVTTLTGASVSLYARYDGTGQGDVGSVPYSFVSTASANLTNVKSSAGTVYTLTLINPTATMQYIRLYDKASAPDPSECSANSDCPVLYAPIPTTGDTNGAGFTVPLGPIGIRFANGIGFSISGAACTTVATCTDETNATAGVTLVLGYK